MKNAYTAVLFLTLMLSGSVTYKKDLETVPVMYHSNEELFSYVKPSAVIAAVNEDCCVYAELSSSSKPFAAVKKDTEVEIIQDRTALWYRIVLPITKEVWWVEGKYLNIPEDPPTNTSEMTIDLIEAFVNAMDFESETSYFVWTDIDRQKTYVLSGEKNDWKLIRTFTCSTGVNKTPTTRGIFKTTEKGEWFYSERLKSGGKYWVKFNGSYLFHSVAMDKDKNVSDGVLGVRRSSGCVRMSTPDIHWFYDNVDNGTTVFIY